MHITTCIYACPDKCGPHFISILSLNYTKYSVKPVGPFAYIGFWGAHMVHSYAHKSIKFRKSKFEIHVCIHSTADN